MGWGALDSPVDNLLVVEELQTQDHTRSVEPARDTHTHTHTLLHYTIDTHTHTDTLTHAHRLTWRAARGRRPCVCAS